ncbi:MAG: putative transporter small subunit [Actinomycetota bacterium]|nr:putative transporter small subunit [Actinomycetota bacterium]
MNAIWLSMYTLVWPALVAGVLFVISRAFVAEWRESRREGRDII